MPTFSEPSFAGLIAPLDPAEFVSAYHERTPLVVARRQPGYFSALVNIDRLDAYLSAIRPPVADVLMVKFGHDQDTRAYAGTDGRVDPRRVWAMFADGWTVVLNDMHLHLPELAALCRAAEAQFSQPFQTNLYLTPANAQGFKPHWDTHDVFVLQVAGSKDWVLYDTKLPLPLPGQSFNRNQAPPGPVSREFRLEAGDLLYCPRGLMHGAAATDAWSLHVTLGLMGKTWASLMFEALAAFVLREPDARRLLPVGFARQDADHSEYEPMFRRLARQFAEQAELAPVLTELAESFVDSRPPLAGGQARQVLMLPNLGPQTRIGARPNLIVRLTETAETVTILAEGNAITLPAFAASAAQFALAQPDFSADDLPGPLDMPGRLTLLRRLIQEGLVRSLDA